MIPGQDTSALAREDNEPRRLTQRERVFDCLVEFGPLTPEQVAEILGIKSGVSGNSVAKRMSELRADGMIVPTGNLKRTASGSYAQVMQIATSRTIADIETDLIAAHDAGDELAALRYEREWEASL